MTNSKRSILSALASLGALLALSACIDPIIIGGDGNGGSGNSGNPAPCMTDAQCAMGQVCVNGVCAGPAEPTCDGVPSPLSCTPTSCGPGEICVPDPDPNACYPSSCACDATTGVWVCTADCGQGNHCVPAQQCSPNAPPCPPGTVCDATGMCVPVCAGTPEVCNGIDDDCDGAIDEQDDPTVLLCPNGGMCLMGQCIGDTPCMSDADCGPNRLCIGGVCSGGTTCTQESCNGIDDDCNGVVDDGAGAVCADGTVCINGMCGGNPQMCGPNGPPCPPGQMCSSGGWCVPGGCMNLPEICNGTDDDCDGQVDEQDPGTVPLCPNGSQCVMGQCHNTTQQCGPMLPPCPAGQVCTPNGVCSSGGCMPAPEVCNGIDDDCDNAIDEVTPGTTLCPNGGQCVMGQCGGNTTPCGPMNPCPAGQVCTANGTCVQGGCVPAPEVCNGIDDDCDNAIDEQTAGTTLCPNGGQCVMGQCSGTPAQCGPMNPCPMGQVCTPNGVCTGGGCMPTPETCNGIDDDCDGIVDDVTPGTTLCQGGICLAGQCHLVCTSNNNCPAGTTCTNGICQ